MREIVGTITCPHCGNREATVHQQASGKGRFYYRCYETQGGMAMRCGTVQIHGPTGQAWIEANIHRARPEAANDPKAPEAPPNPAPEAANDPKAPEAPRRTVLGNFLRHFNEED